MPKLSKRPPRHRPSETDRHRAFLLTQLVLWHPKHRLTQNRRGMSNVTCLKREYPHPNLGEFWWSQASSPNDSPQPGWCWPSQPPPPPPPSASSLLPPSSRQPAHMRSRLPHQTPH